MKTLEVYKVTNKQNGKIYIGITNQGASTSRWYKHCSDSNTGSNFPLHNAIRKYGKDNFQIDIVELIENEDYDYLKEREIFWIREFDSYNREKGYNLTLGGDGTFGRFHSTETKDKIRQKAIGRHPSVDAKKHMSDSQKKVKRDYSKLANLSNSKRWSDPDSKIKASKSNINNRPVLKYSLEEVFIEEYYNVSEAARSLNKTHQNIAACARGKLKTAYGYIWKYKDKP
jgi:group I intron endonuclease